MKKVYYREAFSFSYFQWMILHFTTRNVIWNIKWKSWWIFVNFFFLERVNILVLIFRYEDQSAFFLTGMMVFFLYKEVLCWLYLDKWKHYLINTRFQSAKYIYIPSCNCFIVSKNLHKIVTCSGLMFLKYILCSASG